MVKLTFQNSIYFLIVLFSFCFYSHAMKRGVSAVELRKMSNKNQDIFKKAKKQAGLKKSSSVNFGKEHRKSLIDHLYKRENSSRENFLVYYKKITGIKFVKNCSPVAQPCGLYRKKRFLLSQ